MPHIQLNNDMPGIIGLMGFRPETAKPLNELAETLLVGPSSLTRGEREMIASYVSNLNNCQFCTRSHSAIAGVLLEDNFDLVEQVKTNFETAPISSKLKSLLKIAGQVQKQALGVSEEMIKNAKAQGATDIEIHDTVLIAAAFCMYNRYVDGLRATTPDATPVYHDIGRRIAQTGYQFK
ncbi:carboxymuconolactone decarboxylase family protein [uncultured Bdellovibrio sp.]|uniref:carboxymuconolactone decarboxylase family protein n=1 Tax=Bdellovibrio sp. HCB-162 TaxID=3394234 RepID=UPI0025DA6900|nr:carboxymuconolactone decarboxylase family protein [uncultured Bdellovibrio sp.]